MTCLQTFATVPDVLPADLGYSDEQLVALLADGAADEAIGGLQSRYGERLFHFVQGMCRDSHMAQDVVQEVWKRVLLKHALYERGTNFRAWLFEIARNQALSALRTEKRLPRPLSCLRGDDDETTDLLDTVADAGDDRHLEEAEFMAEFRAAVEALPAHYRTVFELCVQQGLPYQEVANRLSMPTGTVAIRIMRARKRLFSALERHFDRLRRPPACFQAAS